ncbi:synembryn-A [Brienomyrus brachyistius]|uniref:synembryn-A n=1 Tax=Brienomyrus brachyistius TaxID=42636 RepID=UPI0020B2DD95|nr:synembryn-A [Brienomyrus brachyistius]
MDLEDVERIIHSIKQGDQDAILAQLQKYNDEYSLCFFFNAEEREKRKQRELEEFRRNKIREYVPESDSDVDAEDTEDPDLILREKLAATLIQFVRSQCQPRILKVCLRTLRILSRDRQALGPLLADSALLTLAQLGGISALPQSEAAAEGSDTDPWCEIGVDGGSTADAEADGFISHADDPSTSLETGNTEIQSAGSDVSHRNQVQEARERHAVGYGTVDAHAMEADHSYDLPHARRNTHGCLLRGKRDRMAKGDDEEDMEEGEVWRKEAMKTLCNIVYNSHWAQERASVLGLLSGLSDRLVQGIHTLAPPCGQFYELRLIFLLTALRPELRAQLQKAGGVSLLTTALEQCLLVQWKGDHHVLLDPTLPPVSLERSQCAIEILKILFNISCCIRRQPLNHEGTTLYRHLAAILRHCMLLSCETEERTEELQSHTVNLLSALPLEYLDVLLSVPLSEGSLEWEGFNMECVHSLLLFMEQRLQRNDKLKERLTPVLNLLTESCRVHRETRRYLRKQILPPLRDVATRPEQGDSVKSRLVRLMTHVDTDIKHCAAELLFVLCKENVSRFVKYTGYGNAAGLLAARGLLGARGMLGVLVRGTSGRYSSDSDSETDEYRQAKGRINLVTGRVEDNQADPMEGMTEEEMEEEARKLFHMFNRLTQDKIIEPVSVTEDERLALLCEQLKDDSSAGDDSEGDTC